MADELELTTDPIVTKSQLLRIIDETKDEEASMIINAVSDLFLRFTNRRRITEGTIEEWTEGDGTDRLWLHASPVDEAQDFTITIYSGGEVSETYTLAGDDFRVVQSDVDAYVLLDSGAFPVPSGGDGANIKLEYTGGWTTVPGAIFAGAIQQARIERLRSDGNLGVVSVSRGGETIRYETSSLIRTVREKWEPYRIEI